MLSNYSRDTLMSYTDHSAQRRFKTNTPDVKWNKEGGVNIKWNKEGGVNVKWNKEGGVNVK